MKVNKRTFLLIALIVLLFFNWYNYHYLDSLIQDFIKDTIEAVPVLFILTKFNSYPEWISLVFLVLINTGISLSVVGTYFWEFRFVKEAAKLLVVYTMTFFILIFISYPLDNNLYVNSCLGALYFLSTPLVECALIPLLKLKMVEPTSGVVNVIE